MDYLLEYDHTREISGRGWCGLSRQIFTVGIVYGIDSSGYVGRYCFPSYADAKEALENWDGAGDPSGNWIKHKGGTGEYRNPTLP
jgi:hypothetical protein